MQHTSLFTRLLNWFRRPRIEPCRVDFGRVPRLRRLRRAADVFWYGGAALVRAELDLTDAHLRSVERYRPRYRDDFYRPIALALGAGEITGPEAVALLDHADQLLGTRDPIGRQSSGAVRCIGEIRARQRASADPTTGAETAAAELTALFVGPR